LETYKIEDEKIVSLAVGKFIESKFDIVEKTSRNFNEESVLGFCDVFVTDNDIYYDGETRPREKGAKEKLWYSNIAVFDRNCNPVKLIKTDYRTERICTNEDETTLYAVVSDKDKRCFIGKISL